MEEKRRQAVQDWLEYRKQQRDSARTDFQKRESARAADESRTPDSNRDIEDDPDAG